MESEGNTFPPLSPGSASVRLLSSSSFPGRSLPHCHVCCHSLPVPSVRWQEAQQVGVTCQMAFCHSLLVFLCVSVAQPWLQSLRGVPARVWGACGPRSLGVLLAWCGVTWVPWGCPSFIRENLLPRACLQRCLPWCRLPHAPSILFPFLSQNVCLILTSPAPAAAFFSCVSADVQWAAVLGSSQWCWSQQDLVVTSPGPPPHRAPVAPCYPHPAI